LRDLVFPRPTYRGRSSPPPMPDCESSVDRNGVGWCIGPIAQWLRWGGQLVGRRSDRVPAAATPSLTSSVVFLGRLSSWLWRPWCGNKWLPCLFACPCPCPLLGNMRKFGHPRRLNEPTTTHGAQYYVIQVLTSLFTWEDAALPWVCRQASDPPAESDPSNNLYVTRTACAHGCSKSTAGGRHGSCSALMLISLRERAGRCSVIKARRSWPDSLSSFSTLGEPVFSS